MKTVPKHVLYSLFVLLLIAAVSGSLPEQNGLPGDPLMGARIYDNWMVALDLKPPGGDHPLWSRQDSNTHREDVTWRCKECHGWDYKGAEGAFGPTSLRYTGFPSLRGVVGASQEEVLAWLDGTNDPDHNFLQYTNLNALNDLAVFLRTMQFDTALIVDYSTGLALGDEANGRGLYLQACSACHGSDGRDINLATPGNPLFVGDVAAVDPWRTIHRIRFGMPVQNMPGTESLAWSLSNVADVLAFSQSLPRGNPDYVIFREVSEQMIERQGEMEPILWGALVILLVIGSGLVWDAMRDR